jgi:hypothetical protein
VISPIAPAPFCTFILDECEQQRRLLYMNAAVLLRERFLNLNRERPASQQHEHMKPIPSSAHREANIYALLVRSDDKQQHLAETIVYLLLIAAAAFSMWFATQQRVTLPLNTVIHTSRG